LALKNSLKIGFGFTTYKRSIYLSSSKYFRMERTAAASVTVTKMQIHCGFESRSKTLYKTQYLQKL